MDIFGRKSPEKQLKKIRKLSMCLPETGRSEDGLRIVTKDDNNVRATIMRPRQDSDIIEDIVIQSGDDRIQKVTRTIKHSGQMSELIPGHTHKEVFDAQDPDVQQLDLDLIIDEMKHLVSRTVAVH